MPHPAIDTRDVALYQVRSVVKLFFKLYVQFIKKKLFFLPPIQPFRNALRSNQIIGLQTLAWQLMSRRCQEGQTHPVSVIVLTLPRLNSIPAFEKLENARAALDIYRSDSEEWERSISQGNWPCALPPSTFSRCYV